MKIQYVYNGVIPEWEAKHIHELLSSQYPHVVELLRLPDEWKKWAENNLSDFLIVKDEYRTKTKKYVTVQGLETVFLFFHSETDKELVAKAFERLVVRKQPFMTIITNDERATQPITYG